LLAAGFVIQDYVEHFGAMNEHSRALIFYIMYKPTKPYWSGVKVTFDYHIVNPLKNKVEISK